MLCLCRVRVHIETRYYIWLQMVPLPGVSAPWHEYKMAYEPIIRDTELQCFPDSFLKSQVGQA